MRLNLMAVLCADSLDVKFAAPWITAMNKRELKQQQGINQALKIWSQNHETRLPVRPAASKVVGPKLAFVPSTMCELGLIIPISAADPHIHAFIINGKRTVRKSVYTVWKCVECGFEKLV